MATPVSRCEILQTILRATRYDAITLAAGRDMEQVTVVAKDKETRASTATEKEKTNKQKKKAVPVSKDELEKLAKDSIVQCDPSTV